MQVVVLQVLQWILRTIFILLMLTLALVFITLTVPVRYQAEGELQEEKPKLKGKITWFFYLIYMKFRYEDTFSFQLRVLGIRVFDSVKRKTKEENKVPEESGKTEPDTERLSEELAESEQELNPKKKAKKKTNIKANAKHIYELWKKEETQITFQRAKKKLSKILKAVFPKNWKVSGVLGFSDPAVTGQLMGALGILYPVLWNKVQIIPDFEKEVINIKGRIKGHIRLGNIIYQTVSLLLNKDCFRFIKLVSSELSSSKTSKKEI